jgi:hypothetical protein
VGVLSVKIERGRIMMKKLMCTLSVVLLVVGFVGCPVTEQLLKTRLQGEWERVQVDEENWKITLTFDGDKISMHSEYVDPQDPQNTWEDTASITEKGTFEVKDSASIQESASIEIKWDGIDDTQVWYIEFFANKGKMAVTAENGMPAAVFTRKYLSSIGG